MRSPGIWSARVVRPEDSSAFECRGDQSDGLQPAVPVHRGSAVWPGLPWMESIVPSHGLAQRIAGTVSRRRQQSPRPGRPDGSDLRSARGPLHYRGPRFDCPVPGGGYVWWYVDAVSDDGAHALTFIAFIGSVFSPYYAWARRHGNAEPLNHSAFNIALY